MYYDARYFSSELKRFTSVDPVIVSPFMRELVEPARLSTHAYVLNNPLKYVDPTGETTTVYESRTEVKVFGFTLYTYGSHAGMSITNDDTNLLYDPAGGYSGETGRTGDIFADGDWNEDDYLGHMSSEGSVNVYTIDTTPEQEQSMLDKIFANDPEIAVPNHAGGGTCSIWTSNVLNEAGISDEGIKLPGNLGDQVDGLDNSTKKTIEKDND